MHDVGPDMSPDMGQAPYNVDLDREAGSPDTMTVNAGPDYDVS
jgi:hypothetical protein